MPRAAFVSVMTLVLVLAPQAARGAGFALLPGVEAAGMGGAFRAVADDWSAAFWNPAGLLHLTGSELSASAQVVAPDFAATPRPLHGFASFPVDQDRRSVWYPAAAGFARIGEERVAYGLAVFAPFGFATRWDLYDLPPGYSSASYPRFDHESALRVVDIHPTIALELADGLAAGAGVTINQASFHLRRVRLAPNPLVAADSSAAALVRAPFEYLPVDVDASGTGLGFGANAGLLWNATARLRVGLSVRAYTDLDLAGDGVLTGYFPASASEESTFAAHYHDLIATGRASAADSARAVQYWRGDVRAAAYSASAKLPLPLGAGVGVAWQATPRLLLAADLEWTNWAQLDAIVVKFRSADASATFGPAADEALPLSWRSVARVAIGGRYAAGTVRGLGVGLVGGYTYEPSPVPDATLTPLFPDGSARHTLSIGGSLSRARFSLTSVYRFSYAADRTVADYTFAGGADPAADPLHRAATPTNVAGAYRTRVHEIVAGVRYGF